jgi:hypothetical protein
VLNARSNLAVSLVQTGDFKQADQELNTVLERQQISLGDTHPAVLKTKNNLANVSYAKGDFKMAWSLHREVLDARTMSLGQKHQDTICSMFNLACVGSKAEWSSDCLRMLQEAANYGFSDVNDVTEESDFDYIRKAKRKEYNAILRQIAKNAQMDETCVRNGPSSPGTTTATRLDRTLELGGDSD